LELACNKSDNRVLHLPVNKISKTEVIDPHEETCNIDVIKYKETTGRRGRVCCLQSLLIKQ